MVSVKLSIDTDQTVTAQLPVTIVASSMTLYYKKINITLPALSSAPPVVLILTGI